MSSSRFFCGLFLKIVCFVHFISFSSHLGELVDNVFVVSTLGFPPPQKRTETMKVHPQLECFGVQFPGKDKDKHRRAMLKVLKEERADDMIIIVSDVHLDKPKVVCSVCLCGWLCVLLRQGSQQINACAFVRCWVDLRRCFQDLSTNQSCLS